MAALPFSSLQLKVSLVTYLREVLTRIADHPINRIEELLAWNLASRVSSTNKTA